jgi:pyruvate ferredoxin oxidoreductase alpha subunit
MALQDSYGVFLEVWDSFEKKFGRAYKPVESYKAEDADVIINLIGAIAGTARIAVDRMREEGKKVGLVRTRLWRPYPFEEMRKALAGAKAVAVVDRALSFGGPGGPIASELRSCLYPLEKKPVVAGFIAGLGGRDVTIEDFYTIVAETEKVLETGYTDEYKMIGVRE